MEKAHLVIVDGQGMDAQALSGLPFSDIRIEKILSHQTEKMKIDSACSELAYLSAFRSAFCIDGRNLYFYGENKKPYFKDEKYGFLSLTHATGAGACLIAPVRCGADIEDITRDVGKIESKIRFRENSERDDVLTVWCAKESFVKLTGEGLSRSFSGIRFHCEQISDECGNRLAWAKTGRIGRILWAVAAEREMEISVTLLSFDEALRATK